MTNLRIGFLWLRLSFRLSGTLVHSPLAAGVLPPTPTPFSRPRCLTPRGFHGGCSCQTRRTRTEQIVSASYQGFWTGNGLGFRPRSRPFSCERGLAQEVSELSQMIANRHAVTTRPPLDGARGAQRPRSRLSAAASGHPHTTHSLHYVVSCRAATGAAALEPAPRLPAFLP